VSAGRDVVACLAVLEGKDAEGIVAELAPALAAVVCTELTPDDLKGLGRPGAAAIASARLAGIAERSGVEAEAVPAAGDAIARAREVARERGGIALLTGSHYLLRRR
jgi:hypothetical protein